ncbi:putative ABC transport system permease protein [Luteibacter sp. UNCMF331Sha3.1]|uniref:ABC transporter permease n=1 Tax=Luteibacter sp. UNCMF331Sha3.1 TaxID=1502760 RepID=UPI0008D8CE11|nr:FtsX-like permease family protein [Luteibacter sp. UNCMF331Sha3.1]SEM49415.1 putative ABC transport system permease protein [Luteibacter sp. UNCMF331Sha3.1]
MHVFKALPRHFGIASILVLQIATVVAVITNCIFVIASTISSAVEAIGIDERGIGVIQSIGVIGSGGTGTQANNLVALAALPGVTHAAFGAVPLHAGNYVSLSSDDAAVGTVRVAVYRGAGDYQGVLGVELVEGKGIDEGMLPDATSDNPEWPAVISRSLRQALFADGRAVGRLMRAGTQRYRVVGVMRDVVSALPAQAKDRMTMLIAKRAADADIGGYYLVRTSPGQVGRALTSALAKLRELNSGHVQPFSRSFEELRAKQASKANALAYALACVVMVLCVITAIGIGALTAHWVRQRRVSIGIRRALGARSSDILAYFLIENASLASIGVGLGAVAAVGINRIGMARLDLGLISPSIVLASSVGVLLVSLACAFYPALRASRISPAAVMRSL